jgi:hypothetical protein
VLAYQPLPGFTATDFNGGPAAIVGILFDGAVTDVRVTIRCTNGVPEPSTSTG